MTTDRLTAVQRDTVFGGYGSWGFGMLVPAAGANDEPLPRGLGWDGCTGVTWRSCIRCRRCSWRSRDVGTRRRPRFDWASAWR